ncbi:mCG1036265, partial [Mus musculus]
ILEIRWPPRERKSMCLETDFRGSFSSQYLFSNHLVRIRAAAVQWANDNPKQDRKHFFPIQNGGLSNVFHKSMYSSPSDDYS